MPSKEEYLNPKNPKQSEDHWLGWLGSQLIARGITVHTPEMPQPYAPDYEKWQAVMDGFNVDADTALVGHSCGAGFLVRWLSENKIQVGKVAFVAPFLDPHHDEVDPTFFNFEIDGNMETRTKGIVMFTSPEDDAEIIESARIISEKISGTQTVSLVGRGHFTLDSMKTEQFPELLDLLIQ